MLSVGFQNTATVKTATLDVPGDVLSFFINFEVILLKSVDEGILKLAVKFYMQCTERVIVNISSIKVICSVPI